MASDQTIGGTFTDRDEQPVTVAIGDETTFEALRDALGDPVWLVGATWQILTSNDYKRGRFVDAFGAWMSRQDRTEASALLQSAGVTTS